MNSSHPVAQAPLRGFASGVADVGNESTIVDCSGTAPTLLRPGWITPWQIESILRVPPAAPDALALRPVMGGLVWLAAPADAAGWFAIRDRLNRAAAGLGGTGDDQP